MTEFRTTSTTRLPSRWPTLLALLPIAGAITVIAVLDREAQLFGPAIATMAGIYLVAFALGRGWTAWPAFLALSVVVTALHILRINPAVGMTVALVPLWLWTVVRRRFADRTTFTVQTAVAAIA